MITLPLELTLISYALEKELVLAKTMMASKLQRFLAGALLVSLYVMLPLPFGLPIYT